MRTVMVGSARECLTRSQRSKSRRLCVWFQPIKKSSSSTKVCGCLGSWLAHPRGEELVRQLAGIFGVSYRAAGMGFVNSFECFV